MAEQSAQIRREVAELGRQADDLGSRWRAGFRRRRRAARRCAIAEQVKDADHRMRALMVSYATENAELSEQIQAAQKADALAIWRRSTLAFSWVWILFGILIITGNVGESNATHIGFYNASALIYPILIVAGFVEIAAMQSRSLRVGLHWRILSFTLPAISGEIACLWALAHEESTSLVLSNTWITLGFTTTTLIGMVLWGRASPLRDD